MAQVLASDISGSQLTVAFQNYEQDSALRKFLVEADDRAEAITTLTSALSSASHPDESALLADKVTAQSVGRDRWLVSVQYVRKRFSPISAAGGSTKFNIRVAYEAMEVYCTPTEYLNGLPYGGQGRDFVKPGGPAGTNTNPNDKPSSWLANLPVLNIQIPFYTTVNPIGGSLGLRIEQFVGRIGTIRVGNTTLTDVRFEGAEFKAVQPTDTFSSGSTRWFGVLNYTYKRSGFYKQILEWQDADSSGNEARWIAKNVPDTGITF